MVPGASPSALYFHHAFSYATIIVLSRLAGPQGERDRLKIVGPKSDFVSLGSLSPSQHVEKLSLVMVTLVPISGDANGYRAVDQTVYFGTNGLDFDAYKSLANLNRPSLD